MIPDYRNKAIKLLGLSFALLLLMFVVIGLRAAGLPAALVAVGVVILATFSVVFYVQGNIALAKAKGYDGSVVAAIIIVASLCLGGLFFAMPLIILFGMKDKNKARRHPHSSERRPPRQFSPAKLPPLRNDDVA
jgi:hypothetical protein